MVVTPDNPKQWMADAEHRAQRYGDDDLLTKAYGHIAELEKRLREAEELIPLLRQKMEMRPAMKAYEAELGVSEWEAFATPDELYLSRRARVWEGE